MTDEQQSQLDAADTPLHGMLAEYNTPRELVLASKKVREAGYTRWDTFAPFPIHGIDKAMGIRMTGLPWIVLCAALTGLATAILLQWWTNAVDYRWIVSGKPFWSIPANVPIMFELTVLFSAFASLFGMLILNNLPLPSHPLDLKERFAKATDDKFFLLIEASDPKFDETDTHELLSATTPAVLDTVLEDRVTEHRLPRGLVYALIIGSVAALLPFALFAKARASKSTEPRIHAIQDMDAQPSYRAQSQNPFFEDQRAMREALEGTVPVGGLEADDHFYRGKKNGGWARTFPEQIEPSELTMDHGQERFGIYCAPCHGYSGDGDGMVSQRATALKQGWVPPTNLHQAYLREMPVGELFNTITNGVRNMPAYGDQVKPADRWAIVMYLRALQRSQAASVNDLTEQERASLR